MMRNFYLSFSSLVLAVLVATTAHASILGDKLSFDGQEDTLQDESRGMVANFDTGTLPFTVGGTNNVANLLTVGDVVYGVVKINEIVPDGGTLAFPPSVFGIYSYQVIDVSSTGLITFGATQAGADAPVSNGSLDAAYSGTTRTDFTLLSIATQLGLDTSILTAAEWAQAATIVIESPTATDGLDTNVVGSGLNGFSILQDSSVYGAGNDYSISLVAGFANNLDTDYYEVQVTNATVARLDNLRNQGNSSGFGDFAGGLSVLYHSFAPNTIFLGVESDHTDGSTSSTHEISIGDAGLNGIRKPSGSGDVADAEWMFKDSAAFRINAVPEPASMLVWAGLLGVGGLVAARRRKAPMA